MALIASLELPERTQMFEADRLSQRPLASPLDTKV